MPHEYEYPRAALTVDCVVLSRGEDGLQVLLVRRLRAPFEGCWALPGGFVDLHETLEQAVLRELEEETGLRLARAEQLGAFDALQRDPRDRVISIAHVAVAEAADHVPRGGDDASEAAWFDVDALPELAFDHAQILAAARSRLGL